MYFTAQNPENPNFLVRIGNSSGFENEMGADRRFFHQNPDKAGKLVSLAKKQNLYPQNGHLCNVFSVITAQNWKKKTPKN